MAGNGKRFCLLANIVLIALCITAVVPFILLVSSSITEEAVINQSGYSFLPKKIDFAAYKYLFMASASIAKAYGMTIVVTITGTAANVFLTMSMGYLLSKKRPGRKKFYIVFCILYHAFFGRDGALVYYLEPGNESQ